MTRARRGPASRETDLYPAVKAFLAREGFDVKGEVGGCDIVAIRGGEPPVLVELKLRFTLALVLQAVDRLRVSDSVYLAVPASELRRRGIRPLCRRLGVGLLAVHGTAGEVEVAVEPGPYRPPHDRRRRLRLVEEHGRRRGDPTPGGVTRVPIMTAYRQEALRVVNALGAGPATVATLRVVAEAPNAGRILARDPYGWFERVERGTYRLRVRPPAGDASGWGSAPSTGEPGPPREPGPADAPAAPHRRRRPASRGRPVALRPPQDGPPGRGEGPIDRGTM